MDLTELFCDVDDFVQSNQNNRPKQISHNKDKNNYSRSNKLSDSEIITIAIAYHQSGYKNFKAYCREYVIKYLNFQFLQLVSY